MASLAGHCCLLWLGVFPHLEHLSCLCCSEDCPLGLVFPPLLTNFFLLTPPEECTSSTKSVFRSVALPLTTVCYLCTSSLWRAIVTAVSRVASLKVHRLTVQQQFCLLSSHFLVLPTHNGLGAAFVD